MFGKGAVAACRVSRSLTIITMPCRGDGLPFLIKSPVIFEEPALPDDILVDIRNLHFAYGDRPVLEGINMTIPRGKVVAIMGGSGCGKTTLLRCIGGQLRPSGGDPCASASIRCAGCRTPNCTGCAGGMGMLFQFGALFTDMSVFENVAFPMREHTDLSGRDDPRPGADEARGGWSARRARPDAGRTVGRHGAAGGAGARRSRSIRC